MADAPSSVAGSAAQRARTENHSSAFTPSAEADHARPRLRAVAGGASIIEPIVGGSGYAVVPRASGHDGEVLAQEWAKDWDENRDEDPLETRTDARLEERSSKAPFLTVVEKNDGKAKARSAIPKEPRRRGLKKLNRKQIAMDWPPAPRGCEWRRSEDGLNLWRCWTDWDDNKTKKIKKSRYAGHLSDDAWRIMKEYDHEAFISIVGERLRRHGGR